MAYRSNRGRSRRSGVRSNRGASRRSGQRSFQRKGRRVRGSTGGNRTIRIVLEQPTANALARPSLLGLKEAPPPRRSQF